jgi:chorismate mutase
MRVVCGQCTETLDINHSKPRSQKVAAFVFSGEFLVTHQNAAAVTTLAAWRQEIDAIDTELLRLLNQRAGIACKIAEIKVSSNLPAYDGNREKVVLDRIASQNDGPFENESVLAIFTTIIHETRRLGTQQMQEIACRTEARS